MAAPLLYTAIVDGLELSSAIASWKFPRGCVAPLDPSKASTLSMLAQGQIELAAPGAVDNTTPARIVRGMPGLHIGVAN